MCFSFFFSPSFSRKLWLLQPARYKTEVTRAVVISCFFFFVLSVPSFYAANCESHPHEHPSVFFFFFFDSFHFFVVFLFTQSPPFFFLTLFFSLSIGADL